MYWLFKHYMKKLIAEYSDAYDAESRATLNANMRPDFYWLDRYLGDKYEWEGKDGSYVRRAKKAAGIE